MVCTGRHHDLGIYFIFFNRHFDQRATTGFISAFVIKRKAASNSFNRRFRTLGFRCFWLSTAVIRRRSIAERSIDERTFMISASFFFITFAFARINIRRRFVPGVRRGFTFFGNKCASFKPLRIARGDRVAPRFYNGLAGFVHTRFIVFEQTIEGIRACGINAHHSGFFGVVVTVYY